MNPANKLITVTSAYFEVVSETLTILAKDKSIVNDDTLIGIVRKATIEKLLESTNGLMQVYNNIEDEMGNPADYS